MEVASTDEAIIFDDKVGIRLVAHIPEILLDNTDRNRTSPFAFTGNRFESVQLVHQLTVVVQ